MNVRNIFKAVAALALMALMNSCNEASDTDLEEIKQCFVNPPESARPGVYWYFMDGNLSKEGMTKDLESMKEKGIGSVVFLEVNVGVPRGNVDFLTPEWKDCFKHAVKECERLGISMILGIGPGWTGSGGPWVKPEESMRHLVASEVHVSGGKKQNIHLDKPLPKRPYFGEGALTEELKKKWQDYYEDVAVLAFPSTNGKVVMKDVEEKALYYRAPYSSAPGVKQYLPREEQLEPLQNGDVISEKQIVDLTSSFNDESVTWDVPKGEWTVMRFGIRNNGAVTRPAPYPGLGFECDKTDTAALMAHIRTFTGELFKTLGERDSSLAGGLKILHMDSWEMGAQNWSPRLREEFQKRRGYDPQPYYPVYAGYVVGDKNISERFLWDLRQTIQELMLENHSLFVKSYAHEHGMQLSIEPYDMNPMQDLELGATADIPMAEFWSPGNFNTGFSAIEASSLANIKGQRVVPSEAFTAHGGWEQYPAKMKNQTDWAFAAGINRLTYHTYQHQCLPDYLRPGMTMGPYGVQWNRNNTWWPYVDAYHKYVARCQYLMQKGQTVSDILYLAPEDAPFVFRAPKSILHGDSLIDKRNYGFDACPASLFHTAYMEDGKITFPSGMKYSILILPHFKTMTLKMLNKIASLVEDGAVVVGLPSEYTPGLADYTVNDQKLRELSLSLWGGKVIPKGIKVNNYGKGKILWGTDLIDHEDNLYVDYELTCKILNQLGITSDFKSDVDKVRYIHKEYKNLDYYFVSNRTDTPINTTCHFRVTGKQPYLWNAVTGEIRELPAYKIEGKYTSIDMSFDTYQSYFVFFSGKLKSSQGKNFHSLKSVQELKGSWQVSFDPKWGGPQKIEFSVLEDWTKNSDEGIKYYSGTAVYSKSFNFDSTVVGKLYLDLGKVNNIAKVWLNGKDLGVVWTSPWQVEITDVLKKGENQLKIEVTNLWPNRLIGDEQKEDNGIVNGQWPEWLLKGEKRPGDRFTFATSHPYRKDSPLFESGLLGPVRILHD